MLFEGTRLWNVQRDGGIFFARQYHGIDDRTTSRRHPLDRQGSFGRIVHFIEQLDRGSKVWDAKRYDATGTLTRFVPFGNYRDRREADVDGYTRTRI